MSAKKSIALIFALSLFVGMLVVPAVSAAPVVEIDATGQYWNLNALADNATLPIPEGSVDQALLDVSNTDSENGTLSVTMNGALVSAGTLPAGNETEIDLTTGNAFNAGGNNIFAITLKNATGANLTHTNYLFIVIEVGLIPTNITTSLVNASSAGEIYTTTYDIASGGNYTLTFANLTHSISGLVSAQSGSYKGFPMFPTVDTDKVVLSVPGVDQTGGEVSITYTVSSTGWYAWGQYVILGVIVAAAVTFIVYFAIKVR